MRLAKPSYGPLAPPVREHGADPETWGRYDVMGHRTLYAGKNLEAAYSEILAHLAPKNALLDSDLRAYFPTSPGKSLGEVIEDEWETLFSIKPTTVVRSFRSDYSEYALTLPGQGWFVDIEHASSISVLNKVFGEQLAAFDVERLTLGTLHSEERLLTTAFAEEQ